MSLSRRERRRSDLPITAEINVTSLVDVAFTLLVIFIITAPILQGGVEVEVPRADVQAISAQDDPFFVTVDSDGTVYVAKSQVSRDEFHDSFEQLVGANPPDVVYIRGDSVANWASMMDIIGTVARVTSQHGGSFALVAEPWPSGQR